MPDAEQDALAGVIEALLSEHESRWTTHGWERLYAVIHCAGECDWKLRQKALMTDEFCYEAHRKHVAEVIATHVTSAGCCDLCDGTGSAADGPCWQCRGTGHPHVPDPTCVLPPEVTV